MEQYDKAEQMFYLAQELNPDCILITSLIENEQKRERLGGIFKQNSICIKDICVP